jgi:primosomal protein N' (replication factor Y)
MLELLGWVRARYISPLATVIERAHPPRVAGEESRVDAAAPPGKPHEPRHGAQPGVTTWLRPLPGEEATACVEGIRTCWATGKQAILLVPEAEPVPATARAVLEAFGDRAVSFLGGDARARYRTWLDIRSGAYDVVVATRPGVFAPLGALGLIWISREVHPGHREDRAPYYHVREVAMARARLEGAACVLASLSPSVETAAAIGQGTVGVARPARSSERAAAPLVETTPPEGEDRSTRLATLLKGARSAALVVSRRGYGVARVCRTCGEPAKCARCGGPIVAERGTAACRVCAAPGACANCGGGSFGIERGGAERVAQWAGHIATVPVRLDTQDGCASPGAGSVLVGTAAAVKDVGPAHLDLVAILDPDRALARPGIHAGEQSLATWMEAAAWAKPRAAGGRVLVQSRKAGHPAIQALVRWEPIPYLSAEGVRRSEAGFPPGHPVYRIAGRGDLAGALRAAGAHTVLSTSAESGTLCLVAVPPDRLDGFRREVLRLVAEGDVERVEAEPQL